MPITFQPHLHVEIAAPDTVYVLGEGERFALSGRAYVRLAALLLEAAHDEATMLARLAAELNPAALRLALASLRGRGLVAEVAHDHGSRAAAFRAAAGVDARATEASLHEQRICVRALPPLDAEATVQTLRDVFPRAEAGEPADGALHVVVVEDYLAPALAAWNDEALARRWTWTLLRPVGTSIWLGPLFAPGEACWACLAFKLRGHRAVEAAVARQLGRDRPPVLTRASLPSTERLAAALLTTELAKHVLGSEQARLDGHVLSFDVLTASLERHRLARREACAACGDARVRTEAPPIVLAPAPKTRDGSQRTRSPQAMLRDRLHLVSPITGVVSRLDRVSAEDDELLHVYRATHPQATMSRTLDGIRELLQSSSAGKGQTDAQARASALGEAIERYSGIFQGHEPRRRATFRELDGAIHPDAVLLFSAAQLDGRDEWNRSHARQHWAPARLDPDEAIEWSPLFSLTRAQPRWLPTSYLYYGYEDRSARHVCPADSNGNAAGSTREEAILHGLFELIERDSVALWWYSRARRPAVDLGALADPYLDAVAAQQRSRGRALWMLDLTSDLQIPVFAAVSCRTDHATEDIAFGFGADFDPRLAATRAVSEVVQLVHGLDGRSARVSDGSFADQFDKWCRIATRANQPYLVPDGTAPTREPASPLASDDVADDVRRLVARLADHDIEVLVLDQTRSEIGLPVVKVIAPGLRHFWARFAPGRLFDVPPRLGWVPRRLDERELNPIPFFI